MPRLSIIIPAHNEEKYIQNTLQSIKNQTDQDFEVIVVANGCTDKTEEIVKKNKVKLISLNEAHVSKARNAGAKEAQGRIFLFLDADTKLSPNSIEKIKKHFKEKYSVATTKVKPDIKKLKYFLALSSKNLYNSTKIYQGCSGALICRKEDFNKVGGYPNLVVKEHRKLTIQLKKLGKFICVPIYVTTSMRRFERWGLIRTSSFWIYQWAKNHLGSLNKSKYEKVR